jgi:hypothetical protein
MIHDADIVKSDEEIAADAAKMAAAAKQGSQVDQTKMAEIKSKELIAKGEQTTRVQVAEMQRETALITLAQTHNMKLDDLRAELKIVREQIAHKERIAAVETAQADKTTRPMPRPLLIPSWGTCDDRPDVRDLERGSHAHHRAPHQSDRRSRKGWLRQGDRKYSRPDPGASPGARLRKTHTQTRRTAARQLRHGRRLCVTTSRPAISRCR